MTKIGYEKRLKIIADMKTVNNQRIVAKNNSVSRRSVQEIMKKFEKSGNVEDLPRSGRPSITSSVENRYLIYLSKRNPTNTASDLMSNWHTNVSVSIDTCKRILRKYGLHGRVAARKPYLNKIQIRKRLRWSKSYSSWNEEQWRNVIFSDESKVELFNRTRKYVRRMNGNRFRSGYTLNTSKFGGKSLMVWGAIKYDGSRSLIKCDGNINSFEYQDILRRGLIPIYNPTDIFIQDNAPCHRSASTVQFLGKEGICYVDDWPPQSPDLNIIENLWYDIKIKVTQRHPKSLDELWNYFQEEWEAYPEEKIKKLYLSIPRRLKAVKLSRGHTTKY